MKLRSMNYKRAFGGGKKVPPMKRMRTIKGLRTGFRIAKKIKRDF